MVWSVVAHVVSFLVDLMDVARPRDERHKDLEILLLRHQVRLLRRRQPEAPRRLSRWEQLILAVLAVKATHLANGPGRRLDQLVLLFRPETVLKWHRELVRRKWSFARRRPAGRPPIAAEVEALIMRPAEEDPGWGYSRIQAELGFTVDRSTVRDVLKRRRMPPATTPARSTRSWTRPACRSARSIAWPTCSPTRISLPARHRRGGGPAGRRGPDAKRRPAHLGDARRRPPHRPSPG